MRSSSEITIVRLGQTSVSVPITPASRRKWKLMEEDSIPLSFNLADSVDFNIGDYIDDEIFGRFTISEDPLPADYDPTAGAYKYTLRFDADWICWKNYIFMLTYGTGASGDPYTRKETEWVLTDKLANHLEVFRQNLEAIGYTGYTVNVHTADIPSHAQAISITYSGTDLLTALKTLAEAYECEFWTTNKVIHFGKCETGTQRIPLSMTDEDSRVINVENMVPSRNDSEYGNRFYAFGSTKNIPETYRKHLTFKADDISQVAGYSGFKDSNRAISQLMLNRSTVQSDSPAQMTYSGAWAEHSYTVIDEDSDEMMSWQVIKEERTTVPIPVVQGWPFSITPYVSPYGSFDYTVYIYDQGGNLLATQTDVTTPLTYTIPAGVDSITVHYSYVFATHQVRPAPLAPTVEWEENLEYAYFAQVSYSGGTFLVRLVDGYFIPVSDRSTTVSYGSLPSDFTLNTEYTLATTGADAIKVLAVPVSYYTADEDSVNLVRLVGERRLMLPRPPYTDTDLQAIASDIQNGYVQRGELSRDQIVEKVVYFENIYPRCALRVTAVEEGEYANDTEYSDGSVTKATLPAFTLQAKLIDGTTDVDFPFDPRTMMGTGQTLTATFLTPDETNNYSHKGSENENACSLMGMTFGVSCSRANGVTTYQLVWNSDYGEKLPNEILRPRVGDAFILAGWNPAAMSSLNIIASAEKELALVADEYARLMEEAQFTFDCSMMSDWILARCSQDGEKYLPDGLLSPGQKVTVHHGALSTDKETRVIGFEYKLDIPYDTPVYTVGETEAYSRLKEIEKSLNATTVNTYSTSGSASSSGASSSSSSSSSSAKETLHLLPGSMTGQSAVDYDGTVEKTMKVPSMVDHLMDGDTLPRIIERDGDRVLVDKEGVEVAGKQFFELVQDTQDPTKYSVKLKDEYVGLWAEGWIAAGGVGSGSGGGGGIDLSRVWQSLTNNTDFPDTKINVAHIPDLTTGKITDLESWIAAKGYAVSSAIPTESTVAGWGFTKNTGTVKSVTLTSGTGITVSNSGTAITTTGSRTISISSAYQTYIDHGETAYGWGNHADAGYLTAHQSLDDYALKTGAWTYNFQVNSLILSGGTLTGPSPISGTHRLSYTYTEGGMSVDAPVTTVTKTVAYLDDIPTSLKSPYSLTFGSKTYDGSAAMAITAEDLGALKTHQTIYGLTLSAGAFTAGTYTPNSAAASFNIPTTLDHISDGATRKLANYLPLTGGTMTGAITMSGTGANIVPAPDDVNYLGASDKRFHAGFIRDLYLSYLRFVDGTTRAERGTFSMGDGYAQVSLSGTATANYMFYSANGFFKQGGGVPLGRSDHRWSKVYSVDGDFSGDLLLGGDVVPATDLGSSLGYSTRRFSGVNAQTVSAKEVNFKATDNSVTTGYLSFQSGYMILRSGANIANSYKQLTFHENYGFYPETSGVNLGYNGTNYRWANIYGVNADLTGDLAMASTSHIDIGPVRIEYDAQNDAIHITTNDSTNHPSIGIYADGFVAAGGVQQNS